MTWWATLLVALLPTLAAVTLGLLTWRSLRGQQQGAGLQSTADAIRLDIENLRTLRGQVDTLWTERNQLRDKLAAAVEELAAARDEAVKLAAELAAARDDLLAATGDISKLRRELDRARERIVLLEREVVRLGGNPETLGGRNGKRRT